LGINPKYPEYTEQTAGFTAYIYAKEGGHKKATDSLYKSLIKTKYNFKTKIFPIKELITALSKPQMQIIFDDFMNNSSFLWNINGAANINILYEKYPKEADEYIVKKGKLYGYPAGDERMDSAKAIISQGSEDAILTMFNSFYGPDFLAKYTFAAAKIKTCLVALNKRSQSIQDKVREEYFYKTAARALNIKLLKWEYDKGKLTDDILKIYTVALLDTSMAVAIEIINHLYKDEKYKELQVSMVTSNEDILNYVTEFAPKLLPEDVADIFIF